MTSTESAAVSALKQSTGEWAHEFNNLLTIILGNASLVLCNLRDNDPNLPGMLSIHGAASRAMHLVQRAQGRPRRGAPVLSPVALYDSLERVCQALPNLIASVIDLGFAPDEGLWLVHSSAELLEELTINLCLGACEILPRDGRLRLEAENVALAEDDALFHRASRSGEFVRLRLSTLGASIPSSSWSCLGEQEPRPGVPISGLETVREIVRQHKGWIECHNDPGQDSHFDLYLPRAQVKVPLPAPVTTATFAVERKKTVLLVDDEEMVRELGRNILRFAGFEVLVAEDGASALAIYERDRERIGVVVLDLTMPRMSGDQAFRQLVAIDSEVRVLFCSGYPEENIQSLNQPQVCGFITKPYRNDELVAAVRAALRGGSVPLNPCPNTQPG